jgi:poly-gamma-glutamate capsule biosynthesis protein CapA/YwtB (metallophosphatase superfamily)
LNLANNHANDFGLDGRRSTDSILASLGLGWVASGARGLSR